MLNVHQYNILLVLLCLYDLIYTCLLAIQTLDTMVIVSVIQNGGVLVTNIAIAFRLTNYLPGRSNFESLTLWQRMLRTEVLSFM